MDSAGLLCTRALIEVAGILVQKRWQDSAANHDLREAVGVVCTKPLAEALRTLNVIGRFRRLSDSGKNGDPGHGKWVCGESEGETEFKLRTKRREIGTIHLEEIGDNAKTALLLLDLDLLNGDLIGTLGAHSNGRLHLFNPVFANVQEFVLARVEDEDGGCPVCKSRGADGDVIRDSRLYIADFKEPIIGRRYRAAIGGDRALENNGGTKHRVVVHIGYRAYNTSSRWKGNPLPAVLLLRWRRGTMG